MKLKLGDFLKRRKDAVDIIDGVKYKRATIRINHNGISVRDEKDGTQIKTKKQFTISKGQFLLSKIDARNGAFGIVPVELDKGIITGNFWTFDVDQSKVLIDFFKAFTETISFTDICIRSSSGTTNRKYLDEKKFLEIDIEVPKIEQQAVAINNYYQKREVINNLQNSGINQREVLTNLRQSILQEAVQGKLTAKWRANNPNIEPASELLKRIEAEKQQLIAEKKIKKEKPLPTIGEDETPYELPMSWEYSRVASVSTIRGGKRVPKGYKLTDTPTPYFYIRITDMKNGSVNLHGLKYITKEVYEQINKYTISKNDLYITIAGTIGNVGEIPDELDGMNLTENAAKIIYYQVNKQYLKLLLSSSFCQSQFMDKVNQMAQPKLALHRIGTTIIPIPPLEEQYAIVEKVNSLMALCDELEQQIETSQTQIEQLMQSCLKEVFDHESN